MRNIFDQYSQNENRLTHALVSALSEDIKLLRAFLSWATGISKLPHSIHVVEQQLADEVEISEEEAERKGLPDAWFYDDDNWSLLIESKVAAPLKKEQLHRHYRTAIRRGFSDILVLTITVNTPKLSLPDYVTSITWTDCYKWLRAQNHSEWAKRVADYMQVMDANWAADGYLQEGTLTVFTGIPFSREYPYNYREAKLYLRQAMDELRKRKELKKELGAELNAPGRGALKGSKGHSIWDFIPLARMTESESFTHYPHLNLSFDRDYLSAVIIIPNGLKSPIRKTLSNIEEDEFVSLIREINKGLKPCLRKAPGAVPIVGISQRHWPSRSAEAIVDARLEFDIRTAFPLKGSQVKHQDQWIRVAHEAITNKKSNMTLHVATRFPYGDGKITNSEKILDRIVESWIACKPLTNFLLK